MIEQYKPLYTVPEVAKVLRVSSNAVYELINEGKLPYLLLGSKKVRGSDLERFIEKYPTEEVITQWNSESGFLLKDALKVWKVYFPKYSFEWLFDRSETN